MNENNRKETKKIILTEDKKANIEMVGQWTRDFWEANPKLKASLGK